MLRQHYMAQTNTGSCVENCYLATDRGQKNFEYPVEALMMFMDAMLDEGFSKEEVRIMTHDVPAFFAVCVRDGR